MSTSSPHPETETHPRTRDFWRRYRLWIGAIFFVSILVIGYWGGRAAYSTVFTSREFARGSVEHRFRGTPAILEQAVPTDAKDVNFGWQAKGETAAFDFARYWCENSFLESDRLQKYFQDHGFVISKADSSELGEAFRSPAGDLVAVLRMGGNDVFLMYRYDSVR